MSNCPQELNAQIQGLQARLTQAENDIMSHYQGISMIVAGLSANPFTTGVGAIGSAFYQAGASSMAALQALYSQLSVLDVKQTTMQLASKLVGSMSAELDALASMVDSALNVAMTTLTTTMTSAGDALANLPSEVATQGQAVALAMASGTLTAVGSALGALETAMQGLQTPLPLPTDLGSLKAGLAALPPSINPNQTVNDAIASVTSLKSTAASLLSSQSDVDKCKSTSSHITS